jgi:hypothetical protein
MLEGTPSATRLLVLHLQSFSAHIVDAYITLQRLRQASNRSPSNTNSTASLVSPFPQTLLSRSLSPLCLEMAATVLHLPLICLASRVPSLHPHLASFRLLCHGLGPVPSHRSWALGDIPPSLFLIQVESITQQLYRTRGARALPSGNYKSARSPYTPTTRESRSNWIHDQAMHCPLRSWTLACHRFLLRVTSRTEYMGLSVLDLRQTASVRVMFTTLKTISS